MLELTRSRGLQQAPECAYILRPRRGRYLQQAQVHAQVLSAAASAMLGDREDSPKAVQVGEKQAEVKETTEQKCIVQVQVCGKVHQLRHCKKFSVLPLEERCYLVERHKLCKACLGSCGQATARKCCRRGKKTNRSSRCADVEEGGNMFEERRSVFGNEIARQDDSSGQDEDWRSRANCKRGQGG
jgi:hypothetical protein